MHPQALQHPYFSVGVRAAMPSSGLSMPSDRPNSHSHASQSHKDATQGCVRSDRTACGVVSGQIILHAGSYQVRSYCMRGCVRSDRTACGVVSGQIVLHAGSYQDCIRIVSGQIVMDVELCRFFTHHGACSPRMQYQNACNIKMHAGQVFMGCNFHIACSFNGRQAVRAHEGPIGHEQDA
eukprot:1161834-Pelagomonas_calceolata.AAC.3